jgi:hypothetical protein
MPAQHDRSRPLPEEVLLVQQDQILAPAIPDGAPEAVREGMVRRRLALMNGACVCGARVVLPNRTMRRAAKGALLQLVCMHKYDCPASNENLRAALDAWPTS